MHEPFARIDDGRIVSVFDDIEATPNQLRWSPLPMPDEPTDFVDGLVTMAGSGGPAVQTGAAAHLYAANRSMQQRAFYDADGELLIVPQQGRQRFVTELGTIDVEPQEIVVIPRGVRFRVELLDGEGRGYVCENFGANFRLPDLGPIGSNGLANPRDFLTPLARFEDVEGPHWLVAKFQGHLWSARMDHSPIDVVAWHGNYAPYKYDLRRFNAIGSISYDHPDPSIFLVLHSASDSAGVSNIDFVAFAPRTLAMRDTFRPPWFHRNIASEFMGLVHGAYDAKAEGFVPGGASLHNSMTGHGPDARDLREGEPRRHDQARRHRATRWRSCSSRAASGGRRARRSSRPSCRTTISAAGRACRSTSTRRDAEPTFVPDRTRAWPADRSTSLLPVRRTATGRGAAGSRRCSPPADPSGAVCRRE